MVVKLKVEMKTTNNATQNEYFYLNQKLMEGTTISTTNYEKIDAFARKIKDLTTNTFSDSYVEFSVSVNEQLAG